MKIPLCIRTSDNAPTNKVTLKTPTGINMSKIVDTNEVKSKIPPAAGKIRITLYWCTYFCVKYNI